LQRCCLKNNRDELQAARGCPEWSETFQGAEL